MSMVCTPNDKGGSGAEQLNVAFGDNRPHDWSVNSTGSPSTYAM
jgi:hypothetical protein